LEESLPGTAAMLERFRRLHDKNGDEQKTVSMKLRRVEAEAG
jgi:hypothetical protein